ncbi:MAG: restriction endonuclease subunit S [Methylobacter sp.]|nr:restriction endonuclease subunit S [Methylobacter sp.]
MNAEYLLQHFDRLSEAPDAIQRLRRFILDLAVRGKLVDQDPNDEPAVELLKRIEAEKVRLVKDGDIRKQEQKSPVEIEEYPFELPNNWQWVRFGGIADFSAGRTPSRHDLSFWNTGDYPWVSIADMKDGGDVITTKETVSEKAKKQVFSSEPAHVGTMIMSFKLTIGKISRLGVSAFHNEAIISIYPHLPELDSYLFKVLPQFSRQGDTKGAIKGATLNRESIANIFLPIPPLTEQYRIVAKVDELMTLCDQLEAAKTEREQSLDRLGAASLQRLNLPVDDEEAFREHVCFIFNHLPRITKRPAHIKQLRQTILNLAVRGKLVEQDPNDEPAAELLKRIQEENAGLVKDGARKKGAALPDVDLEQAPFVLPLGWSWARFPELGIFGRGKSKHRPRNDSKLFEGGNHLLIQTGDVARSQGVIQTYTNKYNDVGLAQSMKWPTGTLCITIAANIADSGILSFDACFPDSVVGFIPASMFQNARYFEYFVRTAKANLLEFAPATAQKNINLEILNAVLIPLPPLAEQTRIVTKVDELMALCDQLEAQLNTTETDSRRFLEAVLHEALAPALEEVA